MSDDRLRLIRGSIDFKPLQEALSKFLDEHEELLADQMESADIYLESEGRIEDIDNYNSCKAGSLRGYVERLGKSSESANLSMLFMLQNTPKAWMRVAFGNLANIFFASHGAWQDGGDKDEIAFNYDQAVRCIAMKNAVSEYREKIIPLVNQYIGQQQNVIKRRQI